MFESEDDPIQHELNWHQHRLDELEDRISVEWPKPDTPVGAEQRLRLAVPMPHTVMTIGARGTSARGSRAAGPSGFALMTEANLGVEVQGGACIDTVGLTLLHADGPFRTLTQTDFAVASSDFVRLGTSSGNIELTAGSVPVHDPAFTVIPDADIPDTPEVDTLSSRQATESEGSNYGECWRALGLLTSIRTLAGFRSGLASGVGAGTVSAPVAALLSGLRAALALGEAAWDACAMAAEAVDPDLDPSPPAEPAVKIHGQGGIAMTSPGKIAAFSSEAVSFQSTQKATLSGGFTASVKSAGNAKLYGVLSATVKSEGALGLKGKVLQASGDCVELKGNEIAAVVGKNKVLVEAKNEVAVNAPRAALGGNVVDVSGAERARVNSKDIVEIDSVNQTRVWSDRAVQVRANRDVEVIGADTELKLESGKATLKSGSSQFVFEPSSLRVFGIRAERSRTCIRGSVDLG